MQYKPRGINIFTWQRFQQNRCTTSTAKRVSTFSYLTTDMNQDAQERLASLFKLHISRSAKVPKCCSTLNVAESLQHNPGCMLAGQGSLIGWVERWAVATAQEAVEGTTAGRG